MFIGKFVERAYQDPVEDLRSRRRDTTDMDLSNSLFQSEVASSLYHRYFDEHCYAEEVGFDAIMLNEHHNGPFCMGAQPNIEAGILARITERVKIVMLGNILPLWDDPLLLAEQLAEIDLISRGRLVNGWVRGTGRESVAHTAQPPYNFERLEEAHALIEKAWTTPGPFRWEGQHFHYRTVNPWVLPYQKPMPAQMACGLISKNSMEWAARRRYPYIMLATEINATKAAFEYYSEVAREEGYEADSVAEVLADDRAVLGLDEGVVVAAAGAGLGELVDVEGLQQVGDLAVDELGTVVGVEPADDEGERPKQAFEDGAEAGRLDTFDRTDELELGDLVDEVEVVEALDVVEVALVDGIHPHVAG